MTVTMKKANRIINVNESQSSGYLKRGYDIIDQQGNVIKGATGGKTVSLSEYNKLKEQIKNSSNDAQLEARCEELYEENKALKEKAKGFAVKGKQLTEENKALRAEVDSLKGSKSQKNSRDNK